MKVEWLGDGSLSAKARDLVEFDMASIRQVIAGARGREPELWVVSTGDYESGGRVLRDSPHTRLVAYTAADHMLYGTDGCNSCARTFDLASRDWDSQTLDAYAAESGVPRPLLERLTALARD